MKIKNKLFLILMMIVILFVTTACVLFIGMLETQTEAEKMEMYHGTLRQMLLSYEHVTDDVERFVFERCRFEGIASIIAGQSNMSTQRIQLSTRLDAIVRNNLYLLDGFIADTEGMLYFSGLKEHEERFTQLHHDGFFDFDRDVRWYRDREGNLYLMRSIYQVFPYKVVAHAVFLIDQEYLGGLIGMDGFMLGEACIINQYGEIILTSKEEQAQNSVIPQLIERIRVGEVLERSGVYGREEYRIFAVQGTSRTWNAIYAVRLKDMLASFYTLRQYVLLMGGALLLGAALVSYLTSYTFTANIRMLKRHISEVKGKEISARIPEMGRDEIGDLANHFNGLLERIEHVYGIMLSEQQAKQQAKYELLEFKYRSLQSQISPHFLCNILTSISLMAISGNSAKVEQLAIDASRYLRSNLSSNDKRHDTIREEVRLVREYLGLVNEISAVRVELNVICPAKLENVLIPNMILQPLVENSIKHGIPPRQSSPFVIDILVSETEHGELCLCIDDNGVGYRKEVLKELRALQADSTFHPQLIGFGTAGVIKRLALQYGDHFCFDVENAPDGGAVTRIVLPGIRYAEMG